jgi:predicted amidohydrolase
MDKFALAFEIAGDKILGFKVRVSKDIVKEGGAGIFYEAMRVADHIKRPIVVHVTDPALPSKEIADKLRPGDIFCHVFHGTGDNIIGQDGKVLPEIIKAQKRGVLMDSCHGKANFAFKIAEKACSQGFKPDIISTDLTTKTWNKSPVYGLPHVMSKFLLLGLSEAEIVERVTKNPARAMKMDGQIGTLTEGTCADVTILRIREGDIIFGDSLDETRKGKRCFVPMATILDGTIMFRSSELWQ